MSTDIEKAATKSWEYDAKYNPNPNNPYAYRSGFKAGAKEVIEHPERCGLTSLRLDETWPLKDVLTKLVDAADALLIKYDYDQTYWEQIQVANKEAKKILEELK